MNPICRFDIPAEDPEVIKTFYHRVFGWTFEKDENDPDSWVIRFAQEGQAVAMTGGIVPRSAPTQPIGCHFVVSSVDEAAAKIRESGGTVFVPKTAVPGKGYYACCLDPEGSYFVVWAHDKEAT